MGLYHLELELFSSSVEVSQTEVLHASFEVIEVSLLSTLAVSINGCIGNVEQVVELERCTVCAEVTLQRLVCFVLVSFVVNRQILEENLRIPTPLTLSRSLFTLL